VVNWRLEFYQEVFHEQPWLSVKPQDDAQMNSLAPVAAPSDLLSWLPPFLHLLLEHLNLLKSHADLDAW
jgi:hypothetical protein